MTPTAVAIFPLNGQLEGKDVGPRFLPAAGVLYLETAAGPYGRLRGAYMMKGDYIDIPNDGNLDTKLSTSILLWVYHEGRPGPIVHYGERESERTVKIWLTPEGAFSVVFANRDKDAAPSKAVITPAVPARTWHHVAAVYDHVSGVASVWFNGSLSVEEDIGQMELATDSSEVRIGALDTGGKEFWGRVSCLQFYWAALTQRTVVELMHYCKDEAGKARRISWFLSDVIMSTTISSNLIESNLSRKTSLTIILGSYKTYGELVSEIRVVRCRSVIFVQFRSYSDTDRIRPPFSAMPAHNKRTWLTASVWRKTNWCINCALMKLMERRERDNS